MLLDTHVLVWLAEGMEDLPRRSRDRLEHAAVEHGLAVAPISFWEIAMLCARGRVALAKPIQDWHRAIVSQPGIQEIAMTAEIAIEAVQLPGRFHADPADRILVASARLLGLTLATRDRRILAYGAQGHVSVTKV